MLNRVGRTRHAVIGAAVTGTALLGLFGVVGAGDQGVLRGEHFDAKQVTIRSDGGDGVRIREVVDIDFGRQERRGYQRIIPNDFGVPTDVTASSPDANDDLDVVQVGDDTRIRIGDPVVTFTGQHRYVVDYTLPDAGVRSGRLALDIIGTDETNETDRFEIVLAGFEIESGDSVRCEVGRAGDIGRSGDFGGCEFEQVPNDIEGDEYRAVVESLDARRGITVYADVDGANEVDAATLPALPSAKSTVFPLVALAQLVVGGVIAAGIFAAFRRRGSNEVFGAGGAADAASLPTPLAPPGPGGLQHDVPIPTPGAWVSDVPTYRVPDSRLAELATIEFVPPRGLEPWQGNILLSEEVGDAAVSAWFSEMIARGAIEVHGVGSDITLQPGQTDARLSAVDRNHLVALFGASPAVELGTYSASFATVWKGIRSEQQRFIRHCGWWQRPIGGGIDFSDAAVVLAVGFSLFVGLGMLMMIAFVAAAVGLLGFFGTIGGAIGLSVIVAVAFAGFGYASMLAARTATGSALTLRTESFRRFLDASEGRHVEWAWEQGLIREYSAWAVALGAADAWSDAVESSNIDEAQRFTTPLLIHTYASTMTSSHTPPSSSGSSGGGGFSGGGGVGGGGGGGSSGSW
ncbi:MAG: hypothetical protein WA964_05395 [Ilumatobacter sp.]|uniref:DUF2207 family protein n=1 Tax=Ilumatobacter sp. TaxID=1967498 RepID=UPI003C745A20